MTQAPVPTTAGTFSYEQTGVNYDLIDPLKVAAQRAAAATAAHLAPRGYSEVTASRGESAYVVDLGPFYLASIVECLGTKALVADEMARLTGRSWYEGIAQDTIAMAVNDLITVGATPLVVQAYWAAGSSEWFDDRQRREALVAGWKRACDVCRVSWGGGETPALQGVVMDGRIDLAASCIGLVNPKSRRTLGDKLTAGDIIVLLGASGIHANGLSLARKLVEQGRCDYLNEVSPRWSYGEALLVPTPLYSTVTEALWAAGIVPHYCINITGHGWRKLLRHPGSFTYHIHSVPPVPLVLAFIQRLAGLGDREAYSTFNMGAGFALFVAPEDAERTVQVARAQGIDALVAGVVGTGPKKLTIAPLGLSYDSRDLEIR